MSFAILQVVQTGGSHCSGRWRDVKAKLCQLCEREVRKLLKNLIKLNITPSLTFLGLRALADPMWDQAWQTWQITLALPSSRFGKLLFFRTLTLTMSSQDQDWSRDSPGLRVHQVLHRAHQVQGL